MKISTIIINYNYGRFLRACLDSVLAQNYDDMEIIVVDDGSEDETDLIMKEYPYVNYIKKAHKGISASRNTGVRTAIGKYIAFLDSDDMWKPDKLRSQIIEMEKQNLDILYGMYENFPDNPSMERMAKISAVNYSLETALIRRSVFDVVGLFNTDLLYGEDTEWYYRCIARGVYIKYSDDIVVRRRMHGNNITIKTKRNVDDSKKILADVLRKRCNERKYSGNNTGA